MKLLRRKFLRLAGGVAIIPALSQFARAESYPNRTARILVGFAAGDASDIIARLLAQQLSERLGQTFIVENRTGAGTNIATEAAVRALQRAYQVRFAPDNGHRQPPVDFREVPESGLAPLALEDDTDINPIRASASLRRAAAGPIKSRGGRYWVLTNALSIRCAGGGL